MSCLAGHRTDKERPIDPREAFVDRGGGDDPLEQRKGAILKLHDHPAERGQRGWNLDQVKDHRLVGPEHRTGCYPEKKRVAYLSGGAGNCNTDGSFHRHPPR